MAKAVLTPRKSVAAKTATHPVTPTITLPSGTVLTKGMAVTLQDIPGLFRFVYSRCGEVTVYGGTGTGKKAFVGFRTVKPEAVVTATANAVTEKLVAKAVAAMPTEFANMTPGQKAAHTKRLKAAAAAMPVAA